MAAGPTDRIIILVHVDDPLVFANNHNDECWGHTLMERRFITKGRSYLTPSEPMDFESIRITIDEEGVLRLDNQEKIKKYLEAAGMVDCNPASQPITKSIIAYIGDHRDEAYGAEQVEQFQREVGQLRWLADTTHPLLAPAASILGSFMSSPCEGCLQATHHAFRWLKGVQDTCLVRDPTDTPVFSASSDADVAGLYTELGEVRSRTGYWITYNGMPVAWLSKLQSCAATSAQVLTAEDEEEPVIALSSCEAETHALSETVKTLLNLGFGAKELGFKVKRPISIAVDAAAAISFAQGTAKRSRMKYIDMRQQWVQQLRNKDEIAYTKVAGTDNDADYFTKVHPRPKHLEFEARLMKRLPR